MAKALYVIQHHVLKSGQGQSFQGKLDEHIME